MSVAQRKARTRRNNESNRRDALLRVSAKLFREKGFDGTSIRDISAAAGMHSGSPFYHFKTKQDILVAVMEQGLAEGLRKTEEVMALTISPEQKLHRLIRAQLGTILEEGNDFIPVLLYDWRSLTSANRRRIVAVKDRYDALWQQVIDELKRAGHMPGDAQLMRLLILGAVNWAGTWYRAGGRLSLDEVADGAARLFLQGAMGASERVPVR
jgi:AcrR family transcriptional regulator